MMALYPLVPVLPEIMLTIGAMVLLMVGAFDKLKRYQTLYGIAIALLLLAALMVAYLPQDPGSHRLGCGGRHVD
jgi:NADH-quinone oxidoreductase subunit N